MKSEQQTVDLNKDLTNGRPGLTFTCRWSPRMILLQVEYQIQYLATRFNNYACASTVTAIKPVGTAASSSYAPSVQ